METERPQHLIVVLIKLFSELIHALIVPTMIALAVSGLISLPFIYSAMHTEVDTLFANMTDEIETAHPELVQE